MKVSINFIANRLRGISQAMDMVFSVPTGTRLAFRIGVIGEEVGR